MENTSRLTLLTRIYQYLGMAECKKMASYNSSKLLCIATVLLITS